VAILDLLYMMGDPSQYFTCYVNFEFYFGDIRVALQTKAEESGKVILNIVCE